MKREVYCAILNSRFETDGGVKNCPNSVLDSDGNWFCEEIRLRECPLYNYIPEILKYKQEQESSDSKLASGLTEDSQSKTSRTDEEEGADKYDQGLMDMADIHE